jgi:hypothetical protein
LQLKFQNTMPMIKLNFLTKLQEVLFDGLENNMCVCERERDHEVLFYGCEINIHVCVCGYK